MPCSGPCHAQPSPMAPSLQHWGTMDGVTAAQALVSLAGPGAHSVRDKQLLRVSVGPVCPCPTPGTAGSKGTFQAYQSCRARWTTKPCRDPT